MEPFARIDDVDIDIFTYPWLGLVCCVVSDGWAEESTIKALKAIGYKYSPFVHSVWPSGDLWAGADQYSADTKRSSSMFNCASMRTYRFTRINEDVQVHAHQ